jgi:YggT family protein
MLTSALTFLLTTVLNLLALLFLLRFFMQLVRAPFNNPLAYMVVSLTDFAVKPVRKFIRNWGKIDLSTLFLALLTQLLLQISLLWLRDFPISVAGQSVWLGVIGMSLLGALKIAFDVFFYAILIQVVLSWVNPHSPISDVLNSLTRPILAPIQRFLPVASGIDFSPIVALIFLQMINVSVIRTVETQLMSLF